MERLFPQRKAKVKKGCRDAIKNCGFHPMGRQTGSAENVDRIDSFLEKEYSKIKSFKIAADC